MLGALMRSQGRIYALDNSEKRLNNLKPRLKRSGLSNLYPQLLTNENDIKVKRLTGKIDRVLVDGSVTAIETRWRPQPAPEWLTFVPSASRPGMIEAFAADLAGRLGIPYVPAFTIRPDGRPQAEQQNSAQQLRNVHDKLALYAAAVRPGR